MATIDSNGVLFYQDSDNFTPPASLNLAQSNLSDLLSSGVRFKRVANTTARTALVSSIGLANITQANPLLVWRADAAAGSQLEYTTNGSTWNVLVTSEYLTAQDTGWTPITFTSNWKSYGGSFATCEVRRIGSVVYMKGLASNTASAGTGSVIGTIPAQFRPLGTRLIPQVPGASTLISGPASTGTAHTHGITTSGTSMRVTVNAVTGGIVYDGPAILSGSSYVGLEATWTVD